MYNIYISTAIINVNIIIVNGNMYIFNVLLLYFKGVYNYTICCDNINIYNNTTNAIYLKY